MFHRLHLFQKLKIKKEPSTFVYLIAMVKIPGNIHIKVPSIFTLPTILTSARACVCLCHCQC